ncbi:MAG: hypothetical protein MRY74_02095 [Neomegalonema sp.]|nr:hypothetical protein [Neomegalonema sp.]
MRGSMCSNGVCWKVGAVLAALVILVASILYFGSARIGASRDEASIGGLADGLAYDDKVRDATLRTMSRAREDVLAKAAPLSAMAAAPTEHCAKEPVVLAEAIQLLAAPRVGATPLARLEIGAVVYRCGTEERWRLVMYPRKGEKGDCATHGRSYKCPYGWVFGEFRTKSGS